MFAIGNEELEGAPDLGDTIVCPHCHLRHPVEHGSRVEQDGTLTPCTRLSFYKCGEDTYLCGIRGVSVMNRRD